MRARYRRTRSLLTAAMAAGVLFMLMTPPVGADEQPGAAQPASANDAKGNGDKKEEKPEFPPFDEVTKDHKKIPGFFDLYYHEKKDHLLAAIPGSMLGKEFLMSSAISGGGFLTGFMWDWQVVRWEEMDKKLVLIEPDPRYDPASKSAVSDVVARTYTDRIVLSTKIVTKRGGDPVIDLDEVLKTDRTGLSSFYGGSVDASLSKWVKTKGFEKNVELAVDLAYMRGREGGQRSRVHYSVSELPKNDYKPRRADERVGYFLTAIKNWGKEHTDKTIFDRYIHRWRLRKANPEAKVSDVHPDDQIVFYIEKTVPVKFRRYVREGILAWNDAFEKAGLRNVMAVRQQTETNEFKDLDPEDVRYNFFRWIVTGGGFAAGPSRVNPRTGQILDADIVWDDSLVRSLLAQYDRLVAKGPAASYDPQLQEFLDKHPEWNFVSQEQRLLGDPPPAPGENLSWEPEVLPLLEKHNHWVCKLATGLQHEMALADFVLRYEGHGGLTDQFIGEFIRHVVTHEVGHTLGLRHNFKASSWKSMEQLLAAKNTDEPTTASVMDYNAPIFAFEKEDQPRFFSPALGPYDHWAIEYGYRHPDDQYKTEEELLAAIASHGNQDGLAYATDEDAGIFSPDPLVNRWDQGSDPLEYAGNRMKLVSRLQKNLDEWSVKEGESYSYMRRVFDGLLFEYRRAATFASRVIGGQDISRNHKGDPDEVPPIRILPAARQRQALDFLVKNVFSEEAFQFEPEMLNKLSPGRWGHWDSDNYDRIREYPLHDRIAAIQFWPLFHIFNPFTISRVYDAELKVPADEDALTVPDLLTKTTAAIWSELTRPVGSTKLTARKPFIPSIRRNLQRMQLSMLINVLLTPPGELMPADAHAVTRMTLKGLSQQIDKVLAADDSDNLDPFTRAHLEGSKARIDKALEAEFRL